MTETGKSLETSKDKYGESERPGSRPSRRLPIDARKLDETWLRMRRHAERIGKAKIPYRADLDPTDPDQTSNAVIRSVLDLEKIPLGQALPEGAKISEMPGIRDNLEDDLKKAEERIRLEQLQKPIAGPDPTAPEDRQVFFDTDGAGNAVYSDEDDGGKSALGAKPSAAPAPTENGKLVEALTRRDDPLDDILGKDPADLTEDEVRRVMVARKGAKIDSERDRLFAFEKAFFEDKYGTGPARYDVTGKMVPPEAIRPINARPVPARGRDGKPEAENLNMLAKAVAAPRDGEASPDVVNALQDVLA